MGIGTAEGAANQAVSTDLCCTLLLSYGQVVKHPLTHKIISRDAVTM